MIAPPFENQSPLKMPRCEARFFSHAMYVSKIDEGAPGAPSKALPRLPIVEPGRRTQHKGVNAYDKMKTNGAGKVKLQALTAWSGVASLFWEQSTFTTTVAAVMHGAPCFAVGAVASVYQNKSQT